MEKSKTISKKMISIVLSLLMVFSCFSGMSLIAHADYLPDGLEHFIPLLDNGGNVASYDVSIRVYDTQTNIKRAVRLLFSTLTKEQITEKPGWTNISSTNLHNNCYLSGDTKPPKNGTQINVSDVGIDTQDITYDVPSPAGINTLNFEFSAVPLDPNTSYYAYFVLRLGNPDWTLYRILGDSLGTLKPMKINYNKQKTDGTYDTTVINTHYISGQYLDVSKLGTVPTGYQINTSLSTSSGNWNGTSEINIYYDMPLDKMSVSVDDQIHLNLFLDLDFRSKTVNDVSITFAGKTYPCEGKLITESDYDGDYEGLYRFKVVMSPAEIASAIVVTFADYAQTLNTSVKNYCTQLQDDQYTADYADAQALARAMLIYGQAANNVFRDGADEIADISGLDPTAARNAAAVFSDSTGKVTGASFMALTKPEFRFYTASISEYTAAKFYNEAGITAAYSGDNAPSEPLNARFVKNAEGEVLLEVTGVSAENMDKTITVTVNGMPKGKNTITFNGNTFAKAMARDTNPADTQALGAALYNYGVAAKTCFGA